MKRIEYLLYLKSLRSLAKRAVMTKSSKNSENTLKMTVLINFDPSWQLWGRRKKIRKQEEMRKFYKARPLGKLKESPLKDRKKG